MNMRKKMKSFYIAVSIIYVLLTGYEVYVYMNMESTYIGIIYLYINFFIMFLFTTMSINYYKANLIVRFTKDVMAIFLGFFSSFILPFILVGISGFVEESPLFFEKAKVTIQFFKPAVYCMMILLAYDEYRTFTKFDSDFD